MSTFSGEAQTHYGRTKCAATQKRQHNKTHPTHQCYGKLGFRLISPGKSPFQIIAVTVGQVVIVLQPADHNPGCNAEFGRKSPDFPLA